MRQFLMTSLAALLVTAFAVLIVGCPSGPARLGLPDRAVNVNDLGSHWMTFEMEIDQGRFDRFLFRSPPSGSHLLAKVSERPAVASERHLPPPKVEVAYNGGERATEEGAAKSPAPWAPWAIWAAVMTAAANIFLILSARRYARRAERYRNEIAELTGKLVPGKDKM